jgi:hypothetical protein
MVRLLIIGRGAIGAAASTKGMTQMTRYKPTRDEVRLVRQHATREALRWGGTRSAHIEVGQRFNLDDLDRPRSVNLLLVTDHPTWDDTDLDDILPWSTFTDGFELTEDGRAEIDFYVYQRRGDGQGGELCTNVQAVFDRDGLAAIESTMQPILWKRGEAE